MSNIQNALVGLVGLEHVYIFLLETFMWGTKKFNVTFGIRQQDAESLKQHKHDTLYVSVDIRFTKFIRKSNFFLSFVHFLFLPRLWISASPST